MTDINEIANAVASDAALTAWYPTVTMNPAYDFVSDLAHDFQCCVVPMGIEYRNMSRMQTEMTYRIEIGFMAQGIDTDVDSLINEVQNIGIGFLKKTFAGAVCTGIAHDPLHSPEAWETKAMFLSVLTLTLRKFRNG